MEHSVNKAREVNNPIIKQLLDETTAEELAKIDTEMANNKQQTLIPIEFLIDKLGIVFKMDTTDTDIRIMIKSTTKNLQSYVMLNKQVVEMNVYSGYYSYGCEKVGIIGHHIIQTLNKMFPHFNKLDIDYTGLENYLK